MSTMVSLYTVCEIVSADTSAIIVYFILQVAMVTYYMRLAVDSVLKPVLVPSQSVVRVNLLIV